MKILIGADVVPTERNMGLFQNGDAEELVGAKLLDAIESSDFRIFNMEVPLTNKITPISKCGPNLVAPVNTINGYKSLKADLVTLANNHILDQGYQGLSSTVQTLNESGIAWTGVGKNLQDAAKPYVFTMGYMQVGVYACAEHEFSIATDFSAGANPYDPLESFDEVQRLKATCEYVIVLYHGGKEHYRYPSPMLQKVCRKFIDKGADLVVCQHSHCVGCEEQYQNGTIVYGQGNFIFDHQTNEYWQTGLLIQAEIGKRINYIPIRRKNECVRLAEADDADKIIDEFYSRSQEIMQEGFVRQRYELFSLDKLDYYLQQLSGSVGSNVVMRGISKITNQKWRSFLMKTIYGATKKRNVLNCIQCEAHSELIQTALASKQKIID